MIIEFSGSTGAGKTTLAREVQRTLAGQVRATTSSDFIVDRLGWPQVTHPTIRNLIQDLAGLRFLFRSVSQHRAFIVFALRAVIRHTRNPLLAINYLRSIVRRVGTYELFRRSTRDQIILVDEGTILSSHVLFVYSGTLYSQEDIETFARLVPLPELVVCIRAPAHSLVQRSLERSDAPREMRTKNNEVVEQYVTRAARMFDLLVNTKEIRDRVLIVTNPEAADDQRRVLADRIATFIMDHHVGMVQVPTFPARRGEPAPIH